MRSDLTICNMVADRWWSDGVRWLRKLKNLVSGRPALVRPAHRLAGPRGSGSGMRRGGMAVALALRGAKVTGIAPAEDAIDAARAPESGVRIGSDVGAGEALPYAGASFDAVVCVDVLDHVTDLNTVLSDVVRTLRPGRLFLWDTINGTLPPWLVTTTVAEDMLRLLPRGTHDPAMFMRPTDGRMAMQRAELEPGEITGLGPRGLNRRLDLVLGPLPPTEILYMGVGQKPATGTLA